MKRSKFVETYGERIMMPFRTMSSVSSLLLILLLLADWRQLETSLVVTADIGRDGLCSVYTFLPFTYDGATARSIGGKENVVPGFSYMAAALLAMKHFNERDTIVVPQLSDPLIAECAVKFDTNRSRFFDTGSITHQAAESLYQAAAAATAKGLPPPCAIAGPFQDLPAMDLATLATAMKIPMVAARAYNMRVVSNFFSPYTTQIYPDSGMVGRILVQYISSAPHLQRNNYVSVLYPLSDYGIQMREILRVSLEEQSMEWFSVSYDQNKRLEDMLSSLQHLKDRGFRTIIVNMEYPKDELPVIAEAAEQLGMNNNNYFWVWSGPFHVEHVYSQDPILYKIIYGSLWLLAMDRFLFLQERDPFMQSIMSQGSDFVELVNQKNPIKDSDEPGYVFASDDYFQSFDGTDFGQSFIYDSIISIGIGACLAPKNILDSEDDTATLISGYNHNRGIRVARFNGATNRVRFNGVNSSYEGNHPGAREDATSVIWAGLNLLPTMETHNTTIADILIPGNDTWRSVNTWIYADGSAENNPPLRDDTNHNYLNNGLKVLGYCLMGIVVLSCIATCLWVYSNRATQVLKAAQPEFMYGLALGALLCGSPMLPLSFDETSFGGTLDQNQLSAACMSVPWLIATGVVVTYGALFAKLYRVNKVLQFTRRKVEFHHAAWPPAVLLLTAVFILAIWTGVDPLFWERVELDSFTGESIGRCNSDHLAVFASVLAFVLILSMLLTAIMSWMTKDVDEAYSESLWIFTLIVLQVEVCILGIPVLTILRNLSTNGRFVGYAIILWTFPMSTLILIMLPKYLALRRVKLGITGPVKKRGQRATGPKISGLDRPGGYSNPHCASQSPHIGDQSTAKFSTSASASLRFNNSTPMIPVLHHSSDSLGSGLQPNNVRSNSKSRIQEVRSNSKSRIQEVRSNSKGRIQEVPSPANQPAWMIGLAEHNNKLSTLSADSTKDDGIYLMEGSIVESIVEVEEAEESKTTSSNASEDIPESLGIVEKLALMTQARLSQRSNYAPSDRQLPSFKEEESNKECSDDDEECSTSNSKLSDRFDDESI